MQSREAQPPTSTFGVPTEGLDDPDDADEERIELVSEPDAARCTSKNGGGGQLRNLVSSIVELREGNPFLFPAKLEYVLQDPPDFPFRCGSAVELADSLSLIMSELGFWKVVAAFVLLQLATLAVTGDSFFGKLTGGVVESIGELQGLSIKWHMCTGSAMWALAFVQIFFSRFRKGEIAWIHRWCGRVMLFLWFLICGPTAAYLSLYCSPGPNNLQVIMSMFAVVSLDTTVFATYYFWRGWLVAVRRKRGLDSMALHGRAMRLGLTFTMLILWQRPVQFLVIVLRKMLLAATLLVYPSWAQDLESGLSHHAILSLTTALPFGTFFIVFLDGPRSLWATKTVLMEKGDAEEFFGSAHPSVAEILFWRTRFLIYILMRGYVTSGWTADPLLAAAAP